MVPALSAAGGTVGGKIAPRLVSETAAIGTTTEALIVLSEQADLSGAAQLKTKLEKGRYVYNQLRSTAERTQAPLRKMLGERGFSYQTFYAVNAIRVSAANRELLQELEGRGDVLRLEANPMVRSALPGPNLDMNQHTRDITTTALTPGGIEWNVARVAAPGAWALGFNGQGVVVAGADTGVQWNHPSLKSHYRGWNGSTANHDYNWHDATSQHLAVPTDPNFHGTFTTSEMVGDDGVGNQVGVAPGAKWIACRNMDLHGNGTPAQYIDCFEFLLAPYPIGHPELANPAMAPDVINNSWACPPSEGCGVTTLQQIVSTVSAAGIFPVMAAGNSGPSCSTVNLPPAIYSSAFSVGATDNWDRIAQYSSRGPVTADGSNRLKPEIAAPGGSIRGAIAYNNLYQGGWSGTSMAAPEVAGAVAIIWQAKPSLEGQVTATQTLLTSTADPMTSTQTCGAFVGSSVPNAVFGYGMLDILRAVQAH
jgi:subtilisin family serine protease